MSFIARLHVAFECDDHSPYEGTNVLVFEEAEQSAGLTVYEVSLGTKPIESTEYACSCSWEQ